jgi:A/G-specific adenine glycosylase
MLQQTQVTTVIPYYERFITRFCGVEVLASATLGEVLKAWENMGYYARARHLHMAAKKIVASFGGEIPNTWDDLIGLPGIGPYIAGAILSIAFGMRIPALDANVKRVLSRLFALQKLPERSGTGRELRYLAEDLVPPSKPGRFNQALMDFGSLICVPGKPSCQACPVMERCLAFKHGLQEKIPVKKARKPLPHKQLAAAVIFDETGRMLISRRPKEGLLGGLWGFPSRIVKEGKRPESLLQSEVRRELGIHFEVQEKITTIMHTYTHFRITLHAYRCRYEDFFDGDTENTSYRWIRPHELEQHAFSNVDRKVISSLASSDPHP